MNFIAFENLFTYDPVTNAKTALRFIHFIGLALGLGGATLLDMMMIRFCIRGNVHPETYSIFEFSTKIISIGLRILWITGIGFLFFYALNDVIKLSNPKVHAKLAIVLILTVNGIFIHTFILPSVKAQIGKTLFEGVSQIKRSVFIISGAISVVSWYVPVALGVFSQLNFKVPALMLLSGYLFLIILAAAMMHLILYCVQSYPNKPALQAGE